MRRASLSICELCSVKGDNAKGTCDVLTPLVELWLYDDMSREACIGKIMERSDFECFLFFGTSFARHVSNVRQEYLHRCMQKLNAPGEGDIQFYHYLRRGPVLRAVAELGTTWRDSSLTKEKADDKGKGKGKGKGKSKMGKGKKGKGTPPPGLSDKEGPGPSPVQMYLWHPDTQEEFLRKALSATDRESIALIPRLEFASCISRVSQLLESYPREQTAREAPEDLWGWEVIQAAGAYSDISTEIERRFQELPPPWLSDQIDDPEVELLLTALGRADDAASALKVLGQYAGKVKQAKEAVTKMISQVSPTQARTLIRDVMLPRDRGVGLQVAGLKKIAELKIPGPLELYKSAWCGGKCQRDVAGMILMKISTALEPGTNPEDVSFYFDFFKENPYGTDKDDTTWKDDFYHVGLMLLEHLETCTVWCLPYLPSVVAKLATSGEKGLTLKAVEALKKNTSHTSEVLLALTEVLGTARLAVRAKFVTGSGPATPDVIVLRDLASLSNYASLRDIVNASRQMGLAKSDPAVLRKFVYELIRRKRRCDRKRFECNQSLGMYFSCLGELAAHR